MSLTNIRNFALVAVLGFLVSACATGGKKRTANDWYDGTGERLLTQNFYQEAPSWSPNGRVLIFYRETAGGKKGQGSSAKLWAIDITGYNEVKIKTPTDASDPSWSGLLSK